VVAMLMALDRIERRLDDNLDAFLSSPVVVG